MVSGTHEKKINVTCLFWDVCAVNVGSFLPKFCDSLLAHLQVSSSLILLDSPSTTR
jgi:hypothetical protein